MRLPNAASPSLLMPLAAACALAAAVLLAQAPARSAEQAVVLPAPALDLPAAGANQASAVFAGGCFWGIQGVFQHVKGVKEAVSGYAGGAAATAHYEEVGSGRTGHAEAVRIVYDPAQVSYGQLLQLFFSVAHDPTQLNRQYPDSGPQYRSTIFAATPEQHKVAAAYIAQLDAAHTFGKKIVTTIEDGKPFYAAESYHQNYLTLHPESAYIVTYDLPKIANLAKVAPSLYRQSIKQQ